MSNVANGGGKGKAIVFETILSSPGMSEKCKLAIALSRQNILLLCRLLERGLFSDQPAFDDEILVALPKESLEELKAVHQEILSKAHLTDFYQKLKLL